MRDGTMTVIRYGDIDGLVSMPSFHAAGGLMLIWAVRRHRLLVAVSGLWNTLLIAATIFSGAHYVVDVIAAGVLSPSAYGHITRSSADLILPTIWMPLRDKSRPFENSGWRRASGASFFFRTSARPGNQHGRGKRLTVKSHTIESADVYACAPSIARVEVIGFLEGWRSSMVPWVACEPRPTQRSVLQRW